MKKLITLFLSLLLVGVGSVIAQNNQSNSQKVFRPTAKTRNTNSHFTGKTNPSTDNTERASVLNEGFESATFPPTGWTKTVTNASFSWTQATSPHSGAKDAQIVYDPNLVQQNEWLISPTLNLTTLTTPMLNFWWNMSYYWGVNPHNNYDFKVLVSTNSGTSWSVLWTEDSVGTFTSYTYYKQVINLSAYHTCSTFKVAFQYIGSDGASLDVDDISIADLPANSLEFLDIWAGFVTFNPPFLYSGYSQIPLGQAFPVTMDGSVKNSGSATQTNVKLHLKEINSGQTGASVNYPTILTMAHDTMEVDTFHTISSAGTHRIAMYVSSDSIAKSAYKDTFNIVVNTSTNGYYSRDNNYYDGNANWNGLTGASLNAFQMAHLVEVTANTYAKSITTVIAGGTTINAPIKAILYRGWGQTKTVIAESAYHFVQSNEIVTTVGASPKSIELYFTANCPLLQKDSVYFVAIQAFGGSDTVLIASGSDIPQPDYAMYIYDTDNTWYYFGKGNSPSMIRLNTNLTDPTGIVTLEKGNATLYQNVPNPANNSTRISYELTKSEKVAFDIYDLTGRKVMTIDEGNKGSGIHYIDINLTNFSSGTYFYTLRTSDYTKTLKMIVNK